MTKPHTVLFYACDQAVLSLRILLDILYLTQYKVKYGGPSQRQASDTKPLVKALCQCRHCVR